MPVDSRVLVKATIFERDGHCRQPAAHCGKCDRLLRPWIGRGERCQHAALRIHQRSGRRYCPQKIGRERYEAGCDLESEGGCECDGGSTGSHAQPSASRKLHCTVTTRDSDTAEKRLSYIGRTCVDGQWNVPGTITYALGRSRHYAPARPFRNREPFVRSEARRARAVAR
jgi:hypothetical protein